MKDNRGVTLIALVLTTILILILASIAIYSGASTVRFAKFNKAKSEIQIIQSYVNQWNKEYEDAVDQAAKQEILNTYGAETSDSSCDQEVLEKTFRESGATKQNRFRFLSESYLKNELGIEASFDYLINIQDREVILFNGVIFNGETYYTLDDFGLQNVKSVSFDEIEFDAEQGNNTEIVLSNVKLKGTSSSNTSSSDISKFIVEYKKSTDSKWTDVTKDVVKFEDGEEGSKTTKYKFSVADFGEYDVKITTMDKIEDIKEITLKARPGISVGDYIIYTSPTTSVTFTDADTGYSDYATNPGTLAAKDTFRVMDIDSRGNMTLIGAMTDSDSGKPVYFSGALGYNNIVYTLNKKCSDLYKDTNKGITARSIKVEDITSKFNETGNRKLKSGVSISGLSTIGKVTKNTTNNTVTYSNGSTNYPDIFQYETGGMIDTIETTGIIGQSESYNEYGGLTDLTNKLPKPTDLTVPNTHYNTTHKESDFEDSNRASAYQNMFFETNIHYLLASRCILCSANYARFSVRYINRNKFDSEILYSTSNVNYDVLTLCVCPVVYLPSSVEVEVSPSTDTSTYHKTVPHVVK